MAAARFGGKLHAGLAEFDTFCTSSAGTEIARQSLSGQSSGVALLLKAIPSQLRAALVATREITLRILGLKKINPGVRLIRDRDWF